MFDNDKLNVILGGPGCGKTTRLLAIVADEIARGVLPGRIAFVTFTRAAAEEARNRASNLFSLDPKNDLPWFRTIHSLAYHSLGMSHDEVLGPRDWKLFSRIVKEPMKGTYEVDTALIPTMADAVRNIGDSMLRVVDYGSTTCQSLEDAWHDLGDPIEWFRLKRFADTLDAYKREMGKVDFTDMLHLYVAHNSPLPIDVAVIDEAQDLTRAQWRMVEHAFSQCSRVYVGGDDDQAIYRWAGADVEYFLGLKGKHEILPTSHRLPASIFRLAQGVVNRIEHRFPKDYQPSERPGSVDYHRSADSVDLSSGNWLLLARNGYMLSNYEGLCESAGVAYRTRAGSSVNPEHIVAIKTWEGLRSGKLQSALAPELRLVAKFLGVPKPALRETQKYTKDNFPEWPWERIWHVSMAEIPRRVRDYYVACLRRGERLTQEPRVRIETIHGVKGAEADHVVLSTDISAKTQYTADLNPDHEHRVFYVGVTRAKHSLHIIEPQTTVAYEL